uniref:Uncharacterized protein n=1 Tax=Timema bartmani TaxID=61472 RepID=A0A7R9EZY0_9NEOP|nr:unnamed protein product [Timema bartmani]
MSRVHQRRKKAQEQARPWVAAVFIIPEEPGQDRIEVVWPCEKNGECWIWRWGETKGQRDEGRRVEERGEDWDKGRSKLNVRAARNWLPNKHKLMGHVIIVPAPTSLYRQHVKRRQRGEFTSTNKSVQAICEEKTERRVHKYQQVYRKESSQVPTSLYRQYVKRRQKGEFTSTNKSVQAICEEKTERRVHKYQQVYRKESSQVPTSLYRQYVKRRQKGEFTSTNKSVQAICEEKTERRVHKYQQVYRKESSQVPTSLYRQYVKRRQKGEFTSTNKSVQAICEEKTERRVHKYQQVYRKESSQVPTSLYRQYVKRRQKGEFTSTDKSVQATCEEKTERRVHKYQQVYRKESSQAQTSLYRQHVKRRQKGEFTSTDKSVQATCEEKTERRVHRQTDRPRLVGRGPKMARNRCEGGKREGSPVYPAQISSLGDNRTLRDNRLHVDLKECLQNQLSGYLYSLSHTRGRRKRGEGVYKSNHVVKGKYDLSCCCSTWPGMTSQSLFLLMLKILALPREGPLIEGILSSYSVGDYVSGNCTSHKSNPPTALAWHINGIQVIPPLLSCSPGIGALCPPLTEVRVYRD